MKLSENALIVLHNMGRGSHIENVIEMSLLPHAQARKALKWLLAKGFIENVDSSVRLTTAGYEILKITNCPPRPPAPYQVLTIGRDAVGKFHVRGGMTKKEAEKIFRVERMFRTYRTDQAIEVYTIPEALGETLQLPWLRIYELRNWIHA